MSKVRYDADPVASSRRVCGHVENLLSAQKERRGVHAARDRLIDQSLVNPLMSAVFLSENRENR